MTPGNVPGVIKESYKLAFNNTQKKYFFQNDKSADDHKKFVSESITKLFKDNSFLKVGYIRLFLDLI